MEKKGWRAPRVRGSNPLGPKSKREEVKGQRIWFFFANFFAGKRKKFFKSSQAQTFMAKRKQAPKKATVSRKKSSRMRQLTKRMLRLSERSPSVVGDSIKMLGRQMRQGNLTRKQLVDIWLAPLKETTLISALKSYNSGRVPLKRFLERIDAAYEKRIPSEVVNELLGCRKRSFRRKLLEVEKKLRPPKSFITSMVIARAKALAEAGKIPKSMVKEMDRLSWDIHKATHKRHAALKKNNREAETTALEELKALEARQQEKMKEL